MNNKLSQVLEQSPACILLLYCIYRIAILLNTDNVLTSTLQRLWNTFNGLRQLLLFFLSKSQCFYATVGGSAALIFKRFQWSQRMRTRPKYIPCNKSNCNILVSMKRNRSRFIKTWCTTYIVFYVTLTNTLSQMSIQQYQIPPPASWWHE